MNRSLRLAAGLVVSALALWLSLAGKDIGAVWATVCRADYRYLIPYVAILLAGHVLRTVRWGILLEPMAHVPFARLNAVSAVGFMAILLLPLRMGELARPWLLSDPPRLRFSAILSTVVVERVADGIVTALLLVVTLLLVPPTAPAVGLLRVGGLAVLGAFLAGLGFILLAYRNGPAAIRLAHRVIDPFSTRLGSWVAATATTFIEGLRHVPTRRGVLAFLVQTAVFWAIGGWAIAILGRAFALHVGLLEAFTILGIVNAGMMIPAGPAQVGTYQAAVVLALSLFRPAAVLDTAGSAFANVMWAVQLVQVVALGSVFLLSRHIRLERVFALPPAAGEAVESERQRR